MNPRNVIFLVSLSGHWCAILLLRSGNFLFHVKNSVAWNDFIVHTTPLYFFVIFKPYELFYAMIIWTIG